MYGGAAEVGMVVVYHQVMWDGVSHCRVSVQLDMKSAPAAVAPSDARLVLVPESVLETLEILGTGAFGTVYKVATLTTNL